ncbi:MAG: hypothetical protein RR056_02095 [Acetivibrio sp.]
MTKKEQGTDVGVRVDVNVAKIVKYCCVTAILIVGIVFGANLVSQWLKEQKRD